MFSEVVTNNVSKFELFLMFQNLPKYEGANSIK